MIIVIVGRPRLSGMAEDADGDEGAGAVAAAYLLVGLSVPLFFRLVTMGQELGVSLILFGALAACVTYGEASLSLPSGVGFGIGVLLTAFVGLNGWLVGLGISAVAVNLAKNWRIESSVVELDSEFGPAIGSG